jgi:hypothetical protein
MKNEQCCNEKEREETDKDKARHYAPCSICDIKKEGDKRDAAYHPKQRGRVGTPANA